MARPLRIEYEDAVYHVMNRGSGFQDIFHGEEFFELFLETVAEACDRFGIEIFAYCLMSNHYHLLVKTPRANLGRAMRHINGVYPQRYIGYVPPMVFCLEGGIRLLSSIQIPIFFMSQNISI